MVRNFGEASSPTSIHRWVPTDTSIEHAKLANQSALVGSMRVWLPAGGPTAHPHVRARARKISKLKLIMDDD